jgi:biopolymer transport protein ExbD
MIRPPSALLVLVLAACPKPPPAETTPAGDDDLDVEVDPSLPTPHSETVRTCTERRARSEVDLAIARCVAAIKDKNYGKNMAIVGPGCAELFSARPCRDAWVGLAALDAKTAIRTLAKSCGPAYCARLPEERPRICAAAIDEIDDEELDDQVVELLQASIRCDYSWNPDAERFADYVEVFRRGSPAAPAPPAPTAPAADSELHVVVIVVEAVGRYRVTINGKSKTVTRRVKAADLQALVAPLDLGPDTKVILRADGWTPYAVVLATMNALGEAGFLGVELEAGTR